LRGRQVGWPIEILLLNSCAEGFAYDQVVTASASAGRPRAGQHSIRINDQFRLCFIWSDAGLEAVELVDDH